MPRQKPLAEGGAEAMLGLESPAGGRNRGVRCLASATGQSHMNKSYDFIIVGAGITGISTAYHLKLRGVESVLVVDRAGIAAGGTGKSAAIVRQHYSTPLMSQMALESLSILEDLQTETPGAFNQTGWHMLIPPDLVSAARDIVKMQSGLGIDTGFLDDDRRAALDTWLNPHGIGAIVHEPRGGYADPTRVTETLAARFEALGGELRLRTPCRALLRERGRIVGVALEGEDVMAGVVVNAAGPWAKPLAEVAGIEMPLRIVREQDSVWEAREGRPLPETSISNAVDAIYIRPLGERRFIIGQGFPKAYLDVDPYNYRERADPAFEALAQERATSRIPPFQGMRLVASYAALYDVTPDWYHLVGPREGLSGYADACGGSGHGFKVGPAIGQHLAQWLAEERVDDAFRQLSHDRFAAGRRFAGAYGGNRG